MRWLLITTLGTNVGDEFIRIGVQNLIREVDPNASFDLLDKQNPEHWKPREFDRCVWCGMPMWWDLPDGSFCQGIDWWAPLMRGWPTAEKRKFLVLGAGQVFVDEITNLTRYAGAVEEVLKRAWRVTVRQPVIDHPQLINSVCPAAFAIPFATVNRRESKLCNLMPSGGHFPFNEGQREYWEKIVPDISNLLIEDGFLNVAHTAKEKDYAISLGWPSNRVAVFDTPEGYLDLYSRASCFFGNRLHGAVVVAPHAPAWAVTYDSRLKMVERCGGYASKPLNVSKYALYSWIRHANQEFRPAYLADECVKHLDLLRAFAS